MANIIKVGMADLNVCKSPDGLTTLGLGSCVGICLRDPVSKVGGLAHAMLPDSKKIENKDWIDIRTIESDKNHSKIERETKKIEAQMLQRKKRFGIINLQAEILHFLR